MRIFLMTIIAFCLRFEIYSQSSVLGSNPTTQIKVFEYYNHTGEVKWVKLFRIKNYNASLGFWGKGGVAGTVYYVDYQGEGASKVDFVFPQSIYSGQKPNLIVMGNASNDFSWYALKNEDTPGQEYYDVYLKTTPWHVGYSFMIRGSDYEPAFVDENPPSQNWEWSSIANQESVFALKGNGYIGMGVINPQNKLDVNGTIHSKEVKVDINGWSDFVFHSAYKLKPLTEVEHYIQTNGHLENIPSAEQVEKNGVSIGVMQAKLLEKVEELTLYSIEQDKAKVEIKQKVEEQDKKLQEQEKKNSELQAKLTEQSKQIEQLKLLITQKLKP